MILLHNCFSWDIGVQFPWGLCARISIQDLLAFWHDTPVFLTISIPIWISVVDILGGINSLNVVNKGKGI